MTFEPWNSPAGARVRLALWQTMTANGKSTAGPSRLRSPVGLAGDYLLV